MKKLKLYTFPFQVNGKDARAAVITTAWKRACELARIQDCKWFKDRRTVRVLDGSKFCFPNGAEDLLVEKIGEFEDGLPLRKYVVDKVIYRCGLGNYQPLLPEDRVR